MLLFHLIFCVLLWSTIDPTVVVGCSIIQTNFSASWKYDKYADNTWHVMILALLCLLLPSRKRNIDKLSHICTIFAKEHKLHKMPLLLLHCMPSMGTHEAIFSGKSDYTHWRRRRETHSYQMDFSDASKVHTSFYQTANKLPYSAYISRVKNFRETLFLTFSLK